MSASNKLPKSNKANNTKPNRKDHENTQKKLLIKLRQDVEVLSYEETICALDLLLTELQNENIPIHEIQHSYLKGKVYVEHCEELLNNIEQEVLEMNPEAMELDY